jgi:hypothetical protein
LLSAALLLPLPNDASFKKATEQAATHVSAMILRNLAAVEVALLELSLPCDSILQVTRFAVS